MTETPGPPDRPSRAPASLARFLPAVIVLAITGFLGFQVAYSYTRGGGIEAVFGTSIVITLVILLVAIAIVVGLVNLLRPQRRGRAAAEMSFIAAGLLVMGFGSGYFIVPLYDLGYHPPPFVEPSVHPAAQATVTLSLDQAEWVTADVDGLGTCPFVEGGSVGLVSVERAGRLQTKPMSATVDVSVRSGAVLEPGTRVQLALVVNLGAPSAWRPGAAMAAGEGYVTWVGQVPLLAVTADGTNGRAVFEDLPVTGEAPAGWPDRLTGEIGWSCS